jgi:hypothetical protein
MPYGIPGDDDEEKHKDELSFSNDDNDHNNLFF